MADSPLLTKSNSFALEIICVCNETRRTQKESILVNQFVCSGRSICAYIREAFYAHRKAVFFAKLQIALKECSESQYGPELLIESEYYSDHTIFKRCVAIERMPVASINTAKEDLQK